MTVGLDEFKNLTPARPAPREPGPQESICGLELRPLDALLVDSKLVPQSEDLELHSMTRLEP